MGVAPIKGAPAEQAACATCIPVFGSAEWENSYAGKSPPRLWVYEVHGTSPMGGSGAVLGGGGAGAAPHASQHVALHTLSM